MSNPIVAQFYGANGLPLAGLHPSFAAPGYYKTAAGLAVTPPAVTDGGSGDYPFTPSADDLVTGIRYLLDGGVTAVPRFYAGVIDAVPQPVIAPAVVVPPVGQPFDAHNPPTWSASDVNALKAAISSGVLSVHYDGPPARTITYQDLSSMRSLLAEMVAQLRNAAGERSNYRLASFSKGV